MGGRALLFRAIKALPEPVRRVGRKWWLRRLAAGSRAQLCMKCDLRRELVAMPPLPLGYEPTPYSPDLHQKWLQLLQTGEEFGALDEASFQLQLVDTLLPDGAAFVSCEGELVACAAACALEAHLPAATLSYVVALPQHRGKKLGQIVTLEVMARAISAGYDSMVLQTDDHRFPAVKTYLKLGFVPDLAASPDAAARWEAILKF